MRDISTSTIATAYSVGPEEDQSCCFVFPRQTYTGSFQSSHRGRDDLHFGDHIRTLPYFAWRLRGRPYRLNGKKMSTCVGIEGETHSYLSTTEGLPHCTAYYLLHPYLDERLVPEKHYLVSDHHQTLSRARNQLLAKLASSKLDLGQTLGEIRQTGQMMLNRLVQLARFFGALFRGQFRKAARILGVSKPSGKGAASNYLEWKFGWLPLMNDISNGREAIARLLDHSGDLVLHKSVRVKSNLDPHVWSTRYTRKGTITYSVTTGVTYQVNDSFVNGLNALGVANPLSIAWELLPMSFVVDWLVSVGSFLEGLSADYGLIFVSGFETRHVESRVTVEDNAQVPGFENSKFEMLSGGMRRSWLTDFPSPSLSMKLDLDANKALTLLALLTQRRG